MALQGTILSRCKSFGLNIFMYSINLNIEWQIVIFFVATGTFCVAFCSALQWGIIHRLKVKKTEILVKIRKWILQNLSHVRPVIQWALPSPALYPITVSAHQSTCFLSGPQYLMIYPHRGPINYSRCYWVWSGTGNHQGVAPPHSVSRCWSYRHAPCLSCPSLRSSTLAS